MLSQRPDSTGSGIYVQAMIREAGLRGHINYLVAGIEADNKPELDCIPKEQCCFVEFEGEDLRHQIVGMSDVMPYASRRFCDLAEDDLSAYEAAFTGKLIGAVTDFRPDIIHSHHLWILSSLARETIPDLPIVTTCHGSDLRQFTKCDHLQGKVLKGCRKLDAVMALSQAQKADIMHLYGIDGKRIHVVGAGFNADLFSQVTKPHPDPVQIVYAGKLSRAKGVPWMLRAFSEIDSPGWVLHLIGSASGPQEAECLRFADRLGKRVVVHGALMQNEVAEIMKQSHVFVLPSFYEGLALVVLEALACGCRIVVTDLPGISEVFGEVQSNYISRVTPPRLREVDLPFAEDEAAYEANLAGAITEQLYRALAEPQIDLSSMRNQIDSFSWGSVFQRVEGVYLQAVG